MKAARRLLVRVRALGPLRQDLLLAACLSAATAVEIGGQLDTSRRPVLSMASTLVMTAGVALRRRAPVTVAVIALIALGVFVRLAEVSDWMLPSLAGLLYSYTVGAHVPGRRGLLAAAGLTALLVIDVGIDPANRGQTALDVIISGALFVVMPVAVGRALGGRRALTEELEAKAARLEREREEQAREVAAGERSRIARELHDVVAHSVSVMVIQTQAARRVAGQDRQAALGALGSVETAGREALQEMRRMVGVLRRAEGELAAAPAPGVSQIPALAERARAAGLGVELRVHGTPGPLSPGVDLTAYRVVQEALTNAIKHAGPARARVTVRYGVGTLELEVADTGRGPSPAVAHDGGGHGLVGMRERVSLYGGELTTGRGRGGGFAVRARIPLEALVA